MDYYGLKIWFGESHPYNPLNVKQQHLEKI
jgi:hypothetical protein